MMNIDISTSEQKKILILHKASYDINLPLSIILLQIHMKWLHLFLQNKVPMHARGNPVCNVYFSLLTSSIGKHTHWNNLHPMQATRAIE